MFSKFLIRWGLVAVIFYFLSKNGPLQGSFTWEHLTQTFRSFQEPQSFYGLLGGIGCIASATLLAIRRWHFFLHDQGIHLNFAQTYRVGMIGVFFNLALPGAVSGDFVKINVISKLFPNRSLLVPTGCSLLIDRFIGLSALVFVSAASILTAYVTGFSDQLTAIVGPVMLGIFLVFSVTTFILWWTPSPSDPLLFLARLAQKSIPTRLNRLHPLILGLQRTYELLKQYRNKPRLLFQAFLTSLLVQALVIFAFYGFALALKETNVRIFDLLLIKPVVLLICAIPLTPSGLGTGNLAMLSLGKYAGIRNGSDLFALGAAVNLLISLKGAFFYLLLPSKPQKKTKIPPEVQNLPPPITEAPCASKFSL
jgi:uncharacterized protein (TIRG00374 family)